MKISARMFDLCEAATISGGQLNVLGAGINSLTRTEFPSTFQCKLVVHLDIVDASANAQIEIGIDMVTDDGATAEFPTFHDTYTLNSDEPPTMLSIPIILDMKSVELATSGLFRLRLFAQGDEIASCSLIAALSVETE